MANQIEPGPITKWLGGVYCMIQRSGVVINSITLVASMGAFYSTNETLQAVFPSFFGFIAAAVGLVAVWMVLFYILLLPLVVGFNQSEAHKTPERSPLKNDTERIIKILEDGDHACDTGEFDPEMRVESETDESVKERLRALGYR